jgi:hypothetical protein
MLEVFNFNPKKKTVDPVVDGDAFIAINLGNITLVDTDGRDSVFIHLHACNAPIRVKVKPLEFLADLKDRMTSCRKP